MADTSYMSGPSALETFLSSVGRSVFCMANGIQERDTCVAYGASISTPICPRCGAGQEPRPVQNPGGKIKETGP